MANSPLELYEKAYRLQYIENNIAEACDIYQTLITEFEHSNECGYAAIQLQKIDANSALQRMSRKPSGAPKALGIVLLVIGCIALLVSASAIYLHFRDVNTLNESSARIGVAVSKMVSGNTDEALQDLQQLKLDLKGNIAPYAISAEIYRLRNDYAQALAEYEQFKGLYPQKFVPETALAAIRQEREQFENRISAESSLKKSSHPQQQKATPARRKKRPTRKRSAPRRNPSGEQPLIVNQDSISFF
ncbi:MAG: hypothetical protein GF398_13510 [Chitinivibrionales bacterium]|nr:hypothetical protein [Chitinivibrionales bacterium]